MNDVKNATDALKWSLGALLALLKALLLGLGAFAKIFGGRPSSIRPTTPPDPSIGKPPNNIIYSGFPPIAGLDGEGNQLAYGLGLLALFLLAVYTFKETSGEKKTLPKRKRRLPVKA